MPQIEPGLAFEVFKWAAAGGFSALIYILGMKHQQNVQAINLKHLSDTLSEEIKDVSAACDRKYEDFDRKCQRSYEADKVIVSDVNAMKVREEGYKTRIENLEREMKDARVGLHDARVKLETEQNLRLRRAEEEELRREVRETRRMKA